MNKIFRSSGFSQILDEAYNFFSCIEPRRFDAAEKFIGPGIYGIFYYGQFSLYSSIACTSKDYYPIYVGKAVPIGWRQGRGSNTMNSPVLWNRINQHFRSINSVSNLEINDFKFVAMIMNPPETDLISAAENYLIRTYKPIWNSVMDGFGNHDPGKGRYNQAKSDWDVVHPGRPFADKCNGQPMAPPYTSCVFTFLSCLFTLERFVYPLF